MSFSTLPSIPCMQGLLDKLHPVFMEDKEGSCAINGTLHQYLSSMKESINDVPEQWDRFKKYTNPYEFIHTAVPGTKTAVARARPLSRSYFKMFEIIKTFGLLDSAPETGMRTYHIAEGPGGFIEATARMRCNPLDTYYGITLVDAADSAVPGWKKSGLFLDEFKNVEIEKGEDGTGDITNPANLKACYLAHKNAKAELVTADGGFDFSLAYNLQETASHKLVFAEVAFALATQKKGGTFVLKMFDMFTAASVDIIYILCCLYDQVNIIKPCTSRYANSERYLVCRGFRLDNTEAIVRGFFKALGECKNKPDHNVERFLSCEIPYSLTCAIEDVNAVLGQQQIETIASTISVISGIKSDRLESMKRANVQRCVTWCQKYKVAHHKGISNSNIFLTRSSEGKSDSGDEDAD